MNLLTLARDLRRRRARERQGLFVSEGIRTVEELVRSPLRVVGALASPRLAETERGRALRDELARRAVRMAEVTEHEFESASDTDTPQGVLAVAEVPERSLSAVDPVGIVLLLDGVQDPGNTGTILRTAAALGASATVALPGTVDLWNAKVVRSAMGAHFRHPAFHANWDDASRFLRERRIPLWAADAAGEPLGELRAPSPVALAVGNEGAGLGADVRGAAERFVSLPISSEVESLNVAVAAGILLYELRA